MRYPTEFQEIPVTELYVYGEIQEDVLLKLVDNERRVTAGSTRRGFQFSEFKTFDSVPPAIPDTVLNGYEWFSCVFKGNPTRTSLDICADIQVGAVVVVVRTLDPSTGALTFLAVEVLTTSTPESKIDIPDADWCRVEVYGGVLAEVAGFAARESFNWVDVNP